MNDLDLKRPAIIGGLIVGLGSVIPIISLLNCCFCAWALIGGAVASKILVDNTTRPIIASEGAKAGAMAGVIGGGIYLFGQLLLSLSGAASAMMLRILERVAESTNNPDLQATMQQAIEQTANQTGAQRLISALPIAIIGAAVLVGFTVLGGVLGVKFFEKRSGQMPPPGPPPSYPPPPGTGWPQGGA